MVEVLLLSSALAMDAFAVAVGLGARYQSNDSNTQPSTLSVAVLVALYFGVAQGIMPFLGYLLGVAVLGSFASMAHWIASAIFLVLGFKLLWEGWHDDGNENSSQYPIEVNTQSGIDDRHTYLDENNVKDTPNLSVSQKMMLSLAIVTSLDAMAAGFTLNLLAINAWLACFIIAIITAGFSFFGVYLGKKSGVCLEDKAEIVGGVVLMAIGVKIMLFS